MLFWFDLYGFCLFFNCMVLLVFYFLFSCFWFPWFLICKVLGDIDLYDFCFVLIFTVFFCWFGFSRFFFVLVFIRLFIVCTILIYTVFALLFVCFSFDGFPVFFNLHCFACFYLFFFICFLFIRFWCFVFCLYYFCFFIFTVFDLNGLVWFGFYFSICKVLICMVFSFD